MASATITIRLDEQDKRLISEYSRAQGMTLSEFGLAVTGERLERDELVIDIFKVGHHRDVYRGL